MLKKRVFLNAPKRNSVRFLKMLRWKERSPIERAVTTSEFQGESVYAATIVEDEERKGIRIWSVTPTCIFGKAFLKPASLGVIYFYKDNNKLWEINYRGVVEDVLGSDKLLKELGMEWAKGVPSFIFTKPILKAILKGNCTNRDDAVKRYYNSVGIKNMNFKKLSLFDSKNNGWRMYEGHYRVATNLDNLITYKKNIDSYDTQLVNDLVQMSLDMGRQVNFIWSPNRMKVEHDKLSREIMVIKSKYQQHREVDYEAIAPVPKTPVIEILNSNTELLNESILLGHCVGTSSSYFAGVLTLKTLILRYRKGDSFGTAEVNIRGDKPIIAQFRGRFNRFMSNEDEALLIDTLDRPDFKKFIESVVKAREEKKEELEEQYEGSFDDDLPF